MLEATGTRRAVMQVMAVLAVSLSACAKTAGPTQCAGDGECLAPEACRNGVCGCLSREESCGDGRDDDCDGTVDCSDTDCVNGACAGGGYCYDGTCRPSTCNDGVRSGTESDVDCGGACPPCAIGATCAAGENCASGYCPDHFCRYNSSCSNVKASAPNAPTRFYELDLDGEGGEPPIRTHCEMDESGGGWTLLQRTVWDWEETRKLWTVWAGFHGFTLGSAEPGKAFRVAGKHWSMLAPSGEHLLIVRPRSVSGASCERLFYRARGRWDLSDPAQARIADLVNVSNARVFSGDAFSTRDSGPAQQDWVVNQLAVPWTYAGGCGICPSLAAWEFIATGTATAGRPLATSDIEVPDTHGLNVAAACLAAGAPEIRETQGAKYHALEETEYYVR